MFMTTANFAQRVPLAIAPNGESFWRAMSLCLRTPWYLLTYRHQEDGSEFIETTAVAWESTLLEMIQELGVSAVIAVGCIAPSSRDGAQWVMKQARELLLPAEDERHKTGPLLFAVEGEAGLFDSHQTKLSRRKSGRTVLLSIEPQ